MSEQDKAWHSSFKSKFTNSNQVLYKSSTGKEVDDAWHSGILIGGQGRKVALSSLKPRQSQANLELSTLLGAPEAPMAHAVFNGVVPEVIYRSVPFSIIKDHLSRQSASASELDVYEILHVLFDEYEDEFNLDLSQSQRETYQAQIRKDRFNKFLSALVLSRHGDRIKAAEKGNAAEAAFLCLTANNVQAACDVLMKSKDFHLMMLIAQIEQADKQFQDDIRSQIEAWKDQNITSEMTEEIRALYEILSGNTTVSLGKSNVPVEHRATTFTISEKFQLDWLQAFALTSWYGAYKNATIEEAIVHFSNSLETGEEKASPADEDGKLDPLWIVLKIYASLSSDVKDHDDEVPILPQALEALSTPWNSLNTFRLHHAMVAGLSDFPVDVDRDRADQLASDVAFELDASNDIPAATWALLHLSNSDTRIQMIQDLLSRHAASLPSPPDNNDQPSAQWTILTQTLLIPAPWIHSAKALYFRSTFQPNAELHHLILAQSFRDAHECLCRRLAPRLVIDEDWVSLRQGLASFGADPASHVADWDQGGRIYADLVDVLLGSDDSGGTGKNTRPKQPSRGRRQAALDRLRKSLVSWAARFKNRGDDIKAGGSDELEERVAIKEMGRIVAEVLCREHEDGDEAISSKAVLELPMTSDVRFARAKYLGVMDRPGVMAMAR